MTEDITTADRERLAAVDRAVLAEARAARETARACIAAGNIWANGNCLITQRAPTG